MWPKKQDVPNLTYYYVRLSRFIFSWPIGMFALYTVFGSVRKIHGPPTGTRSSNLIRW
jgi:hypothetical protein